MKEIRLILKVLQVKEDQMKKGRIQLSSQIGNHLITTILLRRLISAKLSKTDEIVESVNFRF